MNESVATSRRQFLQGSAALGLIIGFNLPSATRVAAAAPGGAEFVPNAFLRIAPDNIVTVVSKHIEFGQGPYTGIATILADEIDADWSQIRVVSAPADAAKYANLAFGAQGTGGSTAMANSWDQLRNAGAEARARLVAAAAKTWGVNGSEITIEKGVLKHPSGKQATFGELAEAAQAITLTGPAKPKDPSAWRLIGKGVPRVDTVSKTNGTAEFTIDIKLPDMATCVLARPSRFGSKPKSFDPAPALAIPGVKEVFAVPQGVAVLADNFWAARKGREALTIEWDDASAETRSTQAMIAEYRKLAQTQGTVARNDGDAQAALGGGAKTFEATYTFPYLAHAPMEPNDCVIRRTDDGGAELLFGSQLQTVDQMVAAGVLGLKPEQVKIKTMLAGGSFGRRATPAGDMAAEAAEVMKAAKHKGPIKIIWTREDDIKGGRYRPVFVHHIKGALDKDGNIVAWDQVIVGQSFIKGSPFEQALYKNGVDQTMVEGASTLPYEVPNLRVSAHIVEAGVPTLWWRSVGSTHTAYSTETFLDLLAENAGVDPLEVRRKLLGKHPRHLGVLNRAAEAAGWGTPLPKGRARGLAVHESFQSYVAHVVEVSVGPDGLPKVERVVVAADCGVAINPDVIKAQLEGGMGYGLSAAMYGAIDLEDGRVVQSNFDDYRVLRIDEMPPVEVHIVESSEKPTGIGEPGVPTIAPAVANAWAKLTGERIFSLPFARSAGKA
jgi:isoquinoline 1-oxidoreductase beta subunit